ncbi:type II secretion system protein [candidate division KSB1 bacterium]
MNKSIVKRLYDSVRSDQRGFSLLEIVVVIIIIGVLSAIAVQNFSAQTDKRRDASTLAELQDLKRAIVGDPDKISDGIRTDFGYVGDMGALPAALSSLVIDPSGGTSNWSGPYMSVNFNEDPLDYAKDAYNENYVPSGDYLSFYSPGADATVQIAASSAPLLSNTVQILITDRDGRIPQASDLVNISVVITLQSGGSVNGTVTAGGLCTINGVHMGNHIVTVTHAVTAEVVIKRISINPGASPAPVEIIFEALP